MVFRGRPSKACERCRSRRLRCDFQRESCGQCMRASVPCLYRTIQLLRIENESRSVVEKVSKNALNPEPKHFPLSLDLQARDVFFAYYVNGTCWDFLRRFHHPLDCPDYLSSAIQAVGLAYLWHQVYSDTALAAARKCYVLALRKTNKALSSSAETTKDSILVAVLLLDLFEKITDNEPGDSRSWATHVDGALSLVRLRGLEQFHGPFEHRILQRMSYNFIISYVASSLSVPGEIIAIRDYVGDSFPGQGPLRRLSDLMSQYARLRRDIGQHLLSEDESIEAIKNLDANLRAATLDIPRSWQYTTKVLDPISDKTFGYRYDCYPQCNTCLAWNILRVVRILLNERLATYYSSSLASDDSVPLSRFFQETIQTLTMEICASVPQYADCDGPARKWLPPSDGLDNHSHKANDNYRGTRHSHTPRHQADCYTLLLPLYVVGKADAVSGVRDWVVQRLRYIGSHFRIRNGEVLAQLLESGAIVCPWSVYVKLGGYAFTV